MQKRWCFRLPCEQALQFSLAVLKGVHLNFKGFVRKPVHDRLHHALFLPVDFLKLSFISMKRGVVRHTELVDVAGVFLAECRHKLRLHQAGPDGCQNRVFQIRLVDSPAVAAHGLALVARVRAAVVCQGNLAVSAAAIAAFQQE
ncbi:MAG: hypothetical protein ACFCUR_20735 [Rhodomicrobiaceae bacterium]